MRGLFRLANIFNAITLDARFHTLHPDPYPTGKQGELARRQHRHIVNGEHGRVSAGQLLCGVGQGIGSPHRNAAQAPAGREFNLQARRRDDYIHRPVEFLGIPAFQRCAGHMGGACNQPDFVRIALRLE